MATLFTDNIGPRKPTQDITLGTTGETITFPGNDLRVNTFKDKGGNTLWTSDGSGNLTGVNSALKGNLVLLSTQTATNQASVSFTTGIDSTYELYIFKFINIVPVTDAADFSFQASTDGGSSYGVTMTSTFFYAYHFDTTSEGLNYWAAGDEANSTAYQKLVTSTGTDAMENLAGELYLFNPSSTTYVKHFYATMSSYFSGSGAQGAENDFVGGWFNTPSTAINAINFKMDSGNFDGTVKLYGLL